MNKKIVTKRAAKLVPINYEMGKIYKIENSLNKCIYVGSTCSSLSRRFSSHKASCKIDSSLFYTNMRAIGIEHFFITLLENFPCHNKAQLEAREFQMTNAYPKEKLYNSAFNGVTNEINKKMGPHERGVLSGNFHRGSIYVVKKCYRFSWQEDASARSRQFGFTEKRTKQEAYMLCINLQNAMYPLSNKDYFNELPFAEQ